MLKRLEGRDEPILDPELPIVDAHHHLFDRPGARYLFDEYLSDLRAGHRVVASVYVEAGAFPRQGGPEVLRPLGEVEFANGVAAMCESGAYGEVRACAAIVGHADLRLGDGIGALLDRALAAAPGRFRGVRQITMEHPSDAPFRTFFTGRPPTGILESPGFRAGLRQLEARGLSFDAAVFHHQLPAVAAFADAVPGLSVILNHMSVAMGMGMDGPARSALFRDWRAALSDLARRPNVTCKVGGLGMPIWGLGFDARPDPVGSAELAAAWKPYVEAAVGAFGPDRCMFESNFPPDGRSCGYVPAWNALKRIAAGWSDAEKAAVFHGTAARVYRITAPGLP